MMSARLLMESKPGRWNRSKGDRIKARALKSKRGAAVQAGTGQHAGTQFSSVIRGQRHSEGYSRPARTDYGRGNTGRRSCGRIGFFLRACATGMAGGRARLGSQLPGAALGPDTAPLAGV